MAEKTKATLRVTNVEEITLPIKTARYMAALINDNGGPYTDAGYSIHDLESDVSSVYTAEVVDD